MTEAAGSDFHVPLLDVINEFKLSNLTPNADIDGKTLSEPKINRPALQLSGFFEYFDALRLQVLGMVEYSYLQSLNDEFRQKNLRRIFEHRVPAFVLCRGLGLFPEMPQYAEEFNVPVLSTESPTTDFTNEVISWLKLQLAPRITMHGVLLDVYGVGVLIVGESGVGKSETALELIKRGHRFIADDAVEVKRVSKQTLVGSCPENIRYFLELRGIGIIDVRQMFGVQSIKATQTIELVIKLELWDPNKVYDRLGQFDEFTDILGNNIHSHSIPIRPGRSLAIICESAAINHRQKKLGYNAAAALSERVMRGRSGGRSGGDA